MTNNYLNILYNLNPIEDSNNFELFPKEYDGYFLGVTYSVSPSYISEKLKSFSKIELIIGIKNDNYQSKIINDIYYKENLSKIINLEPLDFVNRLSDESKNKLLDKRINIYSPNYPIHSKFFLLSNKENTKYRLIIGSANLSNPGLNNNIPQFEDILVFDSNMELFKTYLKRYKEIKKHTHDYIPDKLKQKIKENIKNKDSSNKNNLNIIIPDHDIKSDNNISANELNKINKPIFIVLNENERQNLIIEEINKLNKKIEEDIENKVLPTDTLDIVKDETQEAISTLPREKVEYEKLYKLTKQFIIKSQKKDQNYKLEMSLPKVKKIIQEIVNVHSIETEKEDHLVRLNLQRLDNNVSHDNIEGNIVAIKENQNVVPYSHFSNTEEITRSLKNIDTIIKGYEKYVSKYNDEIGKKIFEVILYSFTAPFLSLIRKKTLINEERQHIPLFLFIGGIGGSGKSSLLRCISKMMCDNSNLKPFLDYDRISLHKTASVKTTETVSTIKALLQENNVFPLLIDEIPPVFFERDTVGEHIIVSTSNNIDEMAQDYPAFIGTTNCSNYSMDERATRRSYYIKLDVPFTETKRNESIEHYSNIIEKLDTVLFKDFLSRFHKRILNNDIKYIQTDESGLLDFLAVSREIFKEYYEETGLLLPRYFNESRLNDYRQSGKEKWRDLFNSEFKNKLIFSYNKKEGVLYFTPSELDKNQKTHQERRANSYLKALPNHIATGDETNYKIKISAKDFFEWLEISNPYKSLLNIF